MFLELVVLPKQARMSMRFAICGEGRGESEIISSAENTADIKEKHDNGNINNIATYKEERLEGKFVSRNVISKLKSPFLSKRLKFVPTTNKIDSEVNNAIRRVWKKTTAYVAF